jgi:hypothetical protein
MEGTFTSTPNTSSNFPSLVGLMLALRLKLHRLKLQVDSDWNRNPTPITVAPALGLQKKPTPTMNTLILREHAYSTVVDAADGLFRAGVSEDEGEKTVQA